MYRSQTKTLGQVLRDLLEQEPEMHEHILEARALALLPQLVGEHVAPHLGRVEIRDGVLRLQVLSALVRQSLAMGKGILIRRINDSLEAELIRDIALY